MREVFEKVTGGTPLIAIEDDLNLRGVPARDTGRVASASGASGWKEGNEQAQDRLFRLFRAPSGTAPDRSGTPAGTLTVPPGCADRSPGTSGTARPFPDAGDAPINGVASNVRQVAPLACRSWEAGP